MLPLSGIRVLDVAIQGLSDGEMARLAAAGAI